MMFIDRKIPGVMFVHSDYTHHTSDDTPDKVDPVELERCQMIGASAIWFLASLNREEADGSYSWPVRRMRWRESRRPEEPRTG